MLKNTHIYPGNILLIIYLQRKIIETHAEKPKLLRTFN
jgi:hypothetical protein